MPNRLPRTPELALFGNKIARQVAKRFDLTSSIASTYALRFGPRHRELVATTYKIVETNFSPPLTPCARSLALFFLDLQQFEVVRLAGEVDVVEEGGLAVDGGEGEAGEGELAEVEEQVAGDDVEAGGNLVGDLQ